MDFPDAQARQTTFQEAELGLRHVEEYLESASYGKFNVEVVPFHQWVRAEQPYSHYLDGIGFEIEEVDSEVVGKLDPEVDFSGFDLVMIILPSSHFGGGNAGGVVKTEEGYVFTINVNATALPEPDYEFSQWSFWGLVGAHELAHKFGLVDLYPHAEGTFQEAPAPPRGKVWAFHQFGLMGLDVHFSATRRDPLWRDAPEMLAWSRWQLGWLEPHQVKCLAPYNQETTVTLSPVSRPGRGTAMVAVPLPDTRVLVIESRERIGYDAGKAILRPEGNRYQVPTIDTGGVLVYTVEASLGSGELPLKIANDSGSRYLDRYPLLGQGQRVTVEGYTVTVISAANNQHTVTITKTRGS